VKKDKKTREMLLEIMGTPNAKSFTCTRCGQVRPVEQLDYIDQSEAYGDNPNADITVCTICGAKDKAEVRAREARIDRAKEKVGLDCTKCPIYKKDRTVDEIFDKCDGRERLEYSGSTMKCREGWSLEE